jgi:hypothetical protein
VGPTLWISALVAFALFQIPTVGPYVATVAYVTLMVAGIVRYRRRDKARHT